MQAKLMMARKSHARGLKLITFPNPKWQDIFLLQEHKIIGSVFFFFFSSFEEISPPLLTQARAGDNKPNLGFKFQMSSLRSRYQGLSSKLRSAVSCLGPQRPDMNSNACGMRGPLPASSLECGKIVFNSRKAAQTLKI